MKGLEAFGIIMVAFVKGFCMALIPIMSMCASLMAGAISQSQSGSRYPSRTRNDGEADQRFTYTPNQADSYRNRWGD